LNPSLLRHTFRAQRIRLAIVCVALAVWGFILPVIYAEFGAQFRAVLDSGLFPADLMRLGGGDVFSLPGALALSLSHPITLALMSIFAVGFPASAVAGERQRGTLEVLLSRPLSRRRLYATLAIAATVFIGLTLAALELGSVLGSAYAGVLGELALARLPIVWLNAALLFAALASITLGASVSFDRLPPALGIGIGVTVVMYFFEVLGALWPSAAWLQPYSLFHYLQARSILEGVTPWRDLAVLAVTIAGAVGWAIVVFPKRDLAAPS
jgi:ABC-2 type transport system permease protein